MSPRAMALALAVCGSLGASEMMDPPEVGGWQYSHRAYHVAAGALIDVGTIALIDHLAPDWSHRHPIGVQLIAGLVVGTAAVGKEGLDRHYGNEALGHSERDIAITTGAGVVAGFAYTWRFR